MLQVLPRTPSLACVEQQPEWSRRAMRALRQYLADAGVRACATCGFSTELLNGPTESRTGNFIAFAHAAGHPMDWLNIERRPGLIWHGTPDAGRHHALMTTTCRRCLAVTHFDQGIYYDDHRDLTTLTDEEQVERDGR